MCRKPPWSFVGNSDLPDAANATQACPGLRRGSKERNVARGLVSSHGQALRRPTEDRSLRRGRFQTGLGGGLGHQAVSPAMRVPPPSR